MTMPVSALEALLKELVQFTTGENAACPTDKWTIQHSLRLLQQYPAGISKAVLLTELDYLWKTYQKRGEHIGKLKQAITTKQLCVSDVLTGDLTAVDEYRFVLQPLPRKNTKHTNILIASSFLLLGVSLVRTESRAV